MKRRIRGRYAAETRFRALGFVAVAASVLFLAFLLVNMAINGIPGFFRTEIKLAIPITAAKLNLTQAQLAGPDKEAALSAADFAGVVTAAAVTRFGDKGAEFVSDTGWTALREAVTADPSLIGKTVTLWVPAAGNLDLVAKGKSPSADIGPFKEAYARLETDDATRTYFNTNFLSAADSSDPVSVGIWGAFKGSMLTMFVTLVLSFPVGVLSALYLEEYAPRNWWTDMIEVSINNLAAVPSIIFGLLGLAVFLGTFGMPRSAPIVGGLTLALMTMPVIVIAGRNAIKAVAPSIRDAALGIGASPIQVVFQHVLPLALPGILTGTIIGMARALGETAPLLLIGMRAFVGAPPSGLTQPATVLPMQVYLWSNEVNRSFVEKTSAAIIVLLLFLLLMNGVAIYLRNKFERRW
ncbi:phosphate ABC transporter permease PstA [Polymorphobacter sp. PAMC 29334]|nr:phosphate ABC transporter permease PstA [Polymorphobacter sp. PAMC 29334]